ncbi:hypothetical protein JTE90_027991 [Oedothorax gibbosus]|uniref:Chitin-binding type-2 domain-containing protein n=1 Tax=Oedothorax gibbosus TaxID=931172 RepID=A0AAV6VES3_9ARAC|nr:hypothetical protein JTE90_027991 [Oedothorax gibbosus]
MDAKKMFSFVLAQVCWMIGVVEFAASQSVPEPLFNRGCRAQRGQFPHETYCQQYYNCWDGRATIEECPGNLLFNPVISACDYPEAVNCLARLRNPEPSVTGDGRCLKQFGIFPDPLDCTAFYECSHGRAFRQLCPYYTAFDERYSVCVHQYSVECGGRGGVYGTLAPPVFHTPDGGIPGLSGRNSLGGGVSGSGTAASGWDRKGLASSGQWSEPHPPILTKGSSHGIGGIRRSGASTTSGRNAASGEVSVPDADKEGGQNSESQENSPNHGPGSSNRGDNGSRHGPGTLGQSGSGTGPLGQGRNSAGHANKSPGGSERDVEQDSSQSRGQTGTVGGSDQSRGNSAGGSGQSRGSSAGVSGQGRGNIAGVSGSGQGLDGRGGVGPARNGSSQRGSGRIVSESGGVTRAPGVMNGGGPRIIGGNSGRAVGGGSVGSTGGTGGGSSHALGGGSASRVGSAGTRGVSRGGTQGGITGIVDKDISATGQERQYEKPITPETTFRCPHPRGLYPNAVDCSKFWLCREYKPSQLQCPTGQLFDLASLTCMHPEKAQCSSISPRT